MAKIVIIGAGSGFGSRLSIDILSRPPLQDSTIGLCDIDARRLSAVTTYVQRAIQAHKLPATCVSSTNREDLLPGANCVITAVSIGGAAYWGEPYASEIGIPAKYGIDQAVGDTLGPGGVFRFLRTAHEHLQFCKDMERLCPNALLINYTNPMAMLTWLHSVGSSIQNVGLCHSVQGTTQMLARWIGVPYDEIHYIVAGINHQAWVLQFRHRGTDLYPRVREAAERPDVLVHEAVRVEMLRQFGYFVTESSPHNSEYLPYFRRSLDLLNAYGLKPRSVSPVPMQVRGWEKDSGASTNEAEPIPELKRSHEYASQIIEALVTGVPASINGNVMNHGAIPNLPSGACVEVPCMVDRGGVHPCFVGPLPPQCAALNMSNIAVQELAIRAFLDRDREAAFHAVALDPLTAAVLPLPRIRDMFNELWQAEGDRLSHFNPR